MAYSVVDEDLDTSSVLGNEGIQNEVESEKSTDVRSDFPETWLWDIYVIG